MPLETKYLEAYLRDNVEGVNCRKTPIERIEPEGIQTSDGKLHEVDVIILAIGFDAGSGALSRIDIRGRDGRSLKDAVEGRNPHGDGTAGARLSQPVHDRRARSPRPRRCAT